MKYNKRLVLLDLSQRSWFCIYQLKSNVAIGLFNTLC